MAHFFISFVLGRRDLVLLPLYVSSHSVAAIYLFQGHQTTAFSQMLWKPVLGYLEFFLELCKFHGCGIKFIFAWSLSSDNFSSFEFVNTEGFLTNFLKISVRCYFKLMFAKRWHFLIYFRNRKFQGVFPLRIIAKAGEWSVRNLASKNREKTEDLSLDIGLWMEQSSRHYWLAFLEL